MGFIKGIRDLQKQSKEIDKTFDPGAQMQNAMSQMEAANEAMAQQTAAANIAATGADANATIAAVRQAGGMVNFAPLLEIDLTVFPEGLPPYPVTVKQAVEQIYIGKAVAGTSVPVKVDTEDPAVVWINWAGA